MIALKKNDKLIIIIGIVILAVAVLAIALYQDPAQDNGGILFTDPSEDMYEIDWTVQEAELDMISDFASKSEVYETTVSIPRGNLKSVSFNLSWVDDKTFFLGRMGLDEMILEITDPDGGILSESLKSAAKTKDGNIEITLDNIVSRPSDRVEADSQMDAEDMVEEDPYYDDTWEDEEFTIQVGVVVGEILGGIRPRDKGNNFDLEITYEYYYPSSVTSIDDETKTTDTLYSSTTQDTGDDFFGTTVYSSLNFIGFH